MQQIRFALFDILRNLRVNTFFFLQMIAVFLIFSYSLGSILALSDGLRSLESLRGAEAYMMRDSTTPERENQLFSDPETVPKLQEFYDYIASASVKQYAIWGYDGFGNPNVVGGIAINQRTASKGFFDLFKLRVIEGRMFDAKDFEKCEVTPVLIGYSLRDEFEVGSTYDFMDGGTGQETSCVVVGILENNASYPDIRNPMHLISLNNAYLKPFDVFSGSSLESLTDLDMALSSTIFLTGDLDTLRSIEEKSAELDLFSIRFETVESNLEYFIDIVTKVVVYQLLTSAIILLFGAVGMVAALLATQKKNMREYSIHILCGARMVDISLRLTIQVALIFALALLPTLIVFGLSLANAYTILLALILCVLVLVVPLWRLNSTSIPTMIRISE
ncbi:MAG: ABC transporter permease [Coriobacteriia bacterium]|nr:ABC transporter permease [Coriobacteriia bacterium]